MTIAPHESPSTNDDDFVVPFLFDELKFFKDLQLFFLLMVFGDSFAKQEQTVGVWYMLLVFKFEPTLVEMSPLCGSLEEQQNTS